MRGDDPGDDEYVKAWMLFADRSIRQFRIASRGGYEYLNRHFRPKSARSCY